MAFFREFYRLLMARPLQSDDLHRRAERRFARRSAARYSRGNVAIQNEAFITTSDLEAERKSMSQIKIAR